MYVLGTGHRARLAQLTTSELVVEAPATSPAGCRTGGAGRETGWFAHGAQITRPAPETSTARTAIATVYGLRRPRRGRAAVRKAVTGAAGVPACAFIGAGGPA